MTLREKLETAKVANDLFPDLTSKDKKYNQIMVKISIKILEERKKRGMSQNEFADFMGVSQSMIAKWESGQYNFTFKKLAEIIAKLDINFEIVFSKNNDDVEIKEYRNNFYCYSNQAAYPKFTIGYAEKDKLSNAG